MRQLPNSTRSPSADLEHLAVCLGRHLVENLHGLDNAEGLAGLDLRAHVHKRLVARRRGSIENADHGSGHLGALGLRCGGRCLRGGLRCGRRDCGSCNWSGHSARHGHGHGNRLCGARALEFDRGAIGLLNAYAREAAVLHNIGYLGKSFGIHALAPRISTQRDGGVVSAKAQVGRKRPGKVGANRAIGRVVKIAGGIGRVVVNGRRHHALFERHGAGHDLDGARGTDHVTGHRLCRRDVRGARRA